jgi:ribosomal protein L11 methyltransferase
MHCIIGFKMLGYFVIVLMLSYYRIEGLVRYLNHKDFNLYKFHLFDSAMNVENSLLQELRLKFDCDEIDTEILSEFLFEMGSLSVSCEVDSERNLYLEESKWSDIIKTKNWKTAVLKAHFPATFDVSGLEELLRVTFPDVILVTEVLKLENKDWVKVVQSSWAPMVIGDLKISFPWHNETVFDDDLSLPYSDKINHEMMLEGGAAFGTGDHPTTRLCIRWLQRTIGRLASDKGPTILDYGCGSAILGLTGLLYGAKSASGVDIDADSLNSARWNCERNKQAMNLYLVSEDDLYSAEERAVIMNRFRGRNVDITSSSSTYLNLKDLPLKSFDIVIANILAPTLINLAPTFYKHARPGGRVALSGVLSSQANKVIEVYLNYCRDLEIEDDEDGWVLISGEFVS